MANYAEVILPLPLHGTFTYLIPEEMTDQVGRGSRVYVPFGSHKFYTGIVASLHSNTPLGYKVKAISAVLDSDPILRHPQLKFWKWISEYYLCTLGETFKAAVPSGLKVESETVLSLNHNIDLDQADNALTPKESLILNEIISGHNVTLNDLDKSNGGTSTAQYINRLLDKGFLVADEKQSTSYRPKKVTMIKPGAELSDNEWLHHAFDAVAKAPHQERLLIALLDLAKNSEKKEIERDTLLAKARVGYPALKALADKGIIKIEKRIINRFSTPYSGKPINLPSLTDSQHDALRQIDEQWREKNVILLHGVTGSGKTEIYCHAILSALEARKQVLYLVPEISLTTQLTDRLRRIFGSRLLVYHSKFSDSERVDIWNRLLHTHEPLVILGVRSSVFLPFAHLGLVVIDEEHESSYKQFDPAPRYNARDAAIMLASMHGAKTLLGSATPAIDTYYKALNGKYGLVSLTERYQGMELPEVEIVDMSEYRKKKLTDGLLAKPVSDTLRATLNSKKQAIFFQNRRGYTPSIYCTQCGWQPKCIQCDVSMVYHKNIDLLNCHYCGYQTSLPRLCPACGQNTVRQAGYGTERIADHLHSHFPDAQISRMDLDSTRNKDAYQTIIENFALHNTDILIGTQMVSKGLDFDNVTFVGVPNADSLLNFPDFRANERAFNMLVQVAGRAGRRNEKGRVMIQTTDISNPILEFIKKQDYSSYYNYELYQRHQFGYPPFTKIIMVYIKHRDENECNRLAYDYTLKLKYRFGDRVLGPAKPIIGRIANYFIQTIMIKIEATASMNKVKAILHEIFAEMSSEPSMKTAQIYYDVDPV